MKTYLAHSATPDCPNGQLLREHLQNTARIASDFFENAHMPAFAPLAEQIGLYHDAGKYAAAFQEYLRGNGGQRVDHSTLGGQLLLKDLQMPFGQIGAFTVMGHHGCMPDGVATDGGSSLESRQKKPMDEDAVRNFYAEIAPGGLRALPRPPMCRMRAFEASMMIRMFASALVDADFLDTQRYFEPLLFEKRKPFQSVGELLLRFEAYMASLENIAGDTRVNRIRREVRKMCDLAALLPKGFFTLNVPTGGGKTLASLGFALRHIAFHPELKRIIYAMPFTSIIEQNAKVFRDAVGRENVLEHHSSVNWRDQDESARLAAENWDAPLIVTTNVQLFESLYSAKPSKCRKLHNLMNSIIILDEAQALPDAMLRPCLQALCSLVRTYGATAVICTATQPDFNRVWPEKPEVRPIIQGEAQLFQALKRTKATMLGALTDDALLVRVAENRQALCIVNTRKHAQKLYMALKGREGVFHLSALMCPRHRTRVLNAIRKRLSAGEDCVVFSTSLIEAGVDVDFPCVYRALTGLDSIAQAAGRCNRNGALPCADVFVFTPQEVPLSGDTARLGAFTGEIARKYPQDIMSPEAMANYFQLRFLPADQRRDPLDQKGILQAIAEHNDMKFPFERIARDFEMIQSAGEPIFIPYDEEARRLIEELKAVEDSESARSGGRRRFAVPREKGAQETRRSRGELLRELQSVSVTLYPNQIEELKRKGYALSVGGAMVLSAAEAQLARLYTEDCGLVLDAEMTTLIL